MTLRQEATETRPRGGAPSIRPDVLAQLGDEAPEFEELLADPSVRASDIYRVVAARGIRVSEASIRNWCREDRR